jgi:hypothetical protein
MKKINTRKDKCNQLANLCRIKGDYFKEDSYFRLVVSPAELDIDGRFCEEYEDVPTLIMCRVTHLVLKSNWTIPSFHMCTISGTDYHLFSNDDYNLEILGDSGLDHLINYINQLPDSKLTNNLSAEIKRAEWLNISIPSIFPGSDKKDGCDLKHSLDCVYTCNGPFPSDNETFWHEGILDKKEVILNNMTYDERVQYWIKQITKKTAKKLKDLIEKHSDKGYFQSSLEIYTKDTLPENILLQAKIKGFETYKQLTISTGDTIVRKLYRDWCDSDKQFEQAIIKKITTPVAFLIRIKYPSNKALNNSGYLAYQSKQRYNRWNTIIPIVNKQINKVLSKEQHDYLFSLNPKEVCIKEAPYFIPEVIEKLNLMKPLKKFEICKTCVHYKVDCDRKNQRPFVIPNSGDGKVSFKTCNHQSKYPAYKEKCL